MKVTAFCFGLVYFPLDFLSNPWIPWRLSPLILYIHIHIHTYTYTYTHIHTQLVQKTSSICV